MVVSKFRTIRNMFDKKVFKMCCMRRYLGYHVYISVKTVTRTFCRAIFVIQF